MSKKNKDTKSNDLKVPDDVGKNIDIVSPDVGAGSYEDAMHVISSAWRDSDSDWRGWVSETYADHVIVRMDKDFWSIDFTVSDDGDITFAEQNLWEKVQLKTEWVAKHVKNLLCIKSLQPKEDGEIRIGGYGILWGDEDRKDLHGEFFTKETEELATIQKSMGHIPFMFNHGMDKTLKATVIGMVDTFEEDEIGLWFETKITEHKIYRKYVEPLLESEALYPSSGVLPAAKKSIKSTGEITSWPIMEMTGTHIPAEHRMLTTPIATIKQYYPENQDGINEVFKSIGIEDAPKTDEGDEESQSLAKELFQARIDISKLDLSILSGGSKN